MSEESSHFLYIDRKNKIYSFTKPSTSKKFEPISNEDFTLLEKIFTDNVQTSDDFKSMSRSSKQSLPELIVDFIHTFVPEGATEFRINNKSIKYFYGSK